MGVFATVPRRAVGAHIVSQFVAWARHAQIDPKKSLGAIISSLTGEEIRPRQMKEVATT